MNKVKEEEEEEEEQCHHQVAGLVLRLTTTLENDHHLGFKLLDNSYINI